MLLFDYEYLREFEAKIGTARNVVYWTYAEPVYAKTQENPPHCHVPLTFFLDDHIILVKVYVMQSRDRIYGSTILLRFLGIILRFLRLNASSLVFTFLQNAIHEQTRIFFID